MPDYIGPALRGLSQTIQTGLSDIGRSKLDEAKMALQGAEIGQRIRQYREEAPLRALKLTKAVEETREAERKNQPWNVPSWVGESLAAGQGGAAPDAKIWAAQTVPKIATVFGDDAKYDPKVGQIVRQSTGQPVTVADFEKAQDAISGMIGIHTDGDKWLEMQAKNGDPIIQKQIEERDKDPVSYLRHQLDQKVARLNQLQSLGLGEKAMKQAWEGVKYTRDKMDKLLAEQRTEERALDREGRTERRAIEREGRIEGRAVAREDRAEGRQAWEAPQVAGEGDMLPAGTMYQKNAKGEFKVIMKPEQVAIIKEYEGVTGKKYNPATDRLDLEKYVQTKKDNTNIQFTPEAIKAMGERYAQTGELPPMGMGKKAAEARMQIINQWAADLKSKGETPEENAARQSAFKASRNELNQLQAQRGKVLAFARTAEKNLALAGELSEKVDRTGVPVINRWINAGRRAVTGDVDLARFDAALRTAINEYAKVTSSATGGAVTSDTARKEVEDMLKAAMTKKQVQGVIKLLVENELPNRIAGYDEQIVTIKDALANRTPDKIPGKSMGGGKKDNDPLGIR